MRILFFYCAALFCFNAAAQPDSTWLDPVTVTSGIAETALSRSGRNIIVIQGDQFQHLPVHSIDELLRYVPGIEVQSRGVMGVQSDIVIRGGTFQQVVVLLDGIRINDPITGHFNSYIPVATAEIERIEVLKGAASAIYGSDAVGGVVHIITKSFAAKKNIVKKTIAAQLAAGTHDLFAVQAGGFISNGKTALSGGILSNNCDGQQQRGTKGFFNINTVSLSALRHITDQITISFRTAYDDRNFSAQNFYTTFFSDTATERVRSVWNQLRFSYQKAKNTFSLDAGLKTGEDHYLYNKASIPNNNKSKLLQAVLQNQHRFSGTTNLVTGIQLYNRDINSNDRGKHNESQAAAFVLLHQEVFPSFIITPAMRIDWNEQRGSEWVPQLALSYRMVKLQWRGSLGKTIRDADFTERYNNYNKAFVASGRIGNPNLRAETSFNYEAGADFFATKGLKISGTFFQRFYNGLIDYVVTPYSAMPRKENLSPGGTYALAKNIARVQIAGGEVDVLYHKSLSNHKSLVASIGALLLHVQDSEDASPFYISSFARYLFNFNVSFLSPHFNISTSGVYKERAKQVASAIKAELSPNYFVLNGKAEWMLVADKFGLFLQVDNIFDVAYSDLLGAQMPGRWFQAGARYNLKK